MMESWLTNFDVEEKLCVLCGDIENSFEKGLFLGPFDIKNRNKVYIHKACIDSASRYDNETEISIIARILKHPLPCRKYDRLYGSIGCCVVSCSNIYHYQCALSCGMWDSRKWAFFCNFHWPQQVQNISLGARDFLWSLGLVQKPEQYQQR
eukprot:TRINITY_DN4816_c0_g1_i1.p1 TRINITY_DN4816_c0_g1~~TRINITY_DN4816_c0_g1_i1.p1  ORF type:complete len:151 (-),score=14.77 TRINITY_DN4816_c0_g1_i1:345-797(-)